MFQTVSAELKDSARLRGLKCVLSQKTIDRSIGEHLKTRYCKRIDNQQLVWLIVGLGLFPGKKYRQIFRLFAAPWLLMPSSATLTMARKRLAASVIEHLCSTVIKLLAITPQKHPFAFYKGLRLMGVDGTLLDCPDTDANRKAFGRTSNQTSHGAFPKARVVSLCELGTRVLWQNVIGTYHQSEQTLTLKLLDFLTPAMLLLADRHFGVAPIIYRLLDKQVPFLIRCKKGQVFEVEKVFADGSYLSTIYLGKNDRRLHRPGQRIRVIRYTHRDPNRPGCGEVHVLLTSLLDADEYPAIELIELYHVRWEEEIAFSEWKVHLGEGQMLRSQSPAMVRQEIWGKLLAHYILRTLIFRSAEVAEVEPLRISFTGALDVLMARLPEIKKSRVKTKQWLANLINEIADEKLPPRANRINPRKIKKRSKARPTKHDSDRLPPRPNGCFRDHVQMSI
ncbi:IS4 family transposase [Rhodopirellula sp. P2]|uniref:IS4 family transposase n=1 Tax=Rhodopirellula sp. P2 TaxID=2127060 RepID=UPI0023675A5B|nr:IS4 family transposase [Rhodopirellula sp. P2]WDQ15115.1 IS4 family transposase [Rhodopirellula sp. P2]